jgi:hypothetical protein
VPSRGDPGERRVRNAIVVPRFCRIASNDGAAYALRHGTGPGGLHDDAVVLCNSSFTPESSTLLP